MGMTQRTTTRLHGSELRIEYDGSIFALTKEEREFVFLLADALNIHQSKGLVQAMRHLRLRAPGEPTAFDDQRLAAAVMDDLLRTPTSEDSSQVQPLDESEQLPAVEKLDFQCGVCGRYWETQQQLTGHQASKGHRPSDMEAAEQDVLANGACKHHWLMGAPTGNWIHATCKLCSAVKDFPSDPKSEMQRAMEANRKS